MLISRFSLNNRAFALVLILAILLTGVATFLNFPSQEDPEFTIREAVVTARFPGMSPDRVEDLITRRLEEKIREISEVEHIESTSQTGKSVIHVKVFDRYFNLNPIWQNLRNKMRDVASDLPQGTIGPDVNDDFGLVSIASIALTADGFSLEDMRQTAKEVRNRLYWVAGVKRVDLYGIQEERVFLETTNARLAQYGLSPSSLINTLRTQNVILPGGKVEVEGETILIEPTGNFESVKDIQEVAIEIPATQQVAQLRDILTVKRAFIDPPDKPAYFNGEPAIVLAVSMVPGENIEVVGQRLSEQVRLIETSLPVGYTLNYATFQPTLVTASIAEFSGNLYQTVGIVLVVVMIFLGIRTGLIVGTIVPLTMLLSLIVMNQFGILLQRMSTAALIISLGLLVDNGIVMAEDIRRRIGIGEDRKEGAIAAGGELGMPLFTSSLTTILAFMPLMLAQNAAGEYLRSLGQVLIITLLGSWFLALYATPLMCYWFVKASPKVDQVEASQKEFSGRFFTLYRRLLTTVLRFRVLFIGILIAALVATGYVFQFVPKQFFPSSSRSEITAYLYLVNGASSRETDAVVKRLSTWLNDRQANPDIASHIVYVSGGGPRFYLALSPIDADAHAAFVLINSKPGSDNKQIVQRTREYLLAHFPEVRPEVKQLSLGTGESGSVKIRILGQNADALFAAAKQLETGFRAIPGTINIKQDWGNLIRKVVVKVDQNRARRAGVTSEEIANSLNNFLSGSSVTSFRQADVSIPVMLRALKSERFNLDRVRTINVYSASRGTNVPLLQIADFELHWQYGQIKRRDLERTITVSAKHQTLFADQLLERLRPTLDSLSLPAGYRVEIGGEVEDAAKAQSALFYYLPHCLIAIILLLIWQFNSIREPLIIALTIPLAMIGGVIGLLVTGAPFSFTSTLGFLSLAGIIINNAIVLIDRINLELKAGVSPYDAIVNAAVKRLRPILMTTLTTVLGLLPLIFFGGDLWFGMANVIAFGLAMGTVMTLGAVPVLYTILYKTPIRRITKSAEGVRA